MRLINADALEKEIYKWMSKDQETWMDSDIPPIENLVVSIMMTIQEQPTVDAIPVVRCKDCKYWKLSEYNTMGIHVCQRFSGVRGEHDFCSRSERKGDIE